MTAITTRATGTTGVQGVTRKDAPLSNTEIDTNFINLNNNKLELSDTTSVNTANAVVKRDASGNFAAGTISATLSGTATQVSNSITAGTGLSGTAFNGSVAQTWTLANSGVTAGSYGSSTAIPVLTIDAYGRITAASTSSVSTTITLAAGSGTGSVAGGGTLTLSGGTGVTTSVAAGVYTISIGQAVGTTASVTFGSETISGSSQISSLGVGTAASGTAGQIRASNSITSYYSDERLKENITIISGALAKVESLRGVTYNANDIAASFGFTDKEQQVGVLAGDVEKVLPEAVKPAPFDLTKLEDGTEVSASGQNYKTVQYEKIVPLLIEAIKELNKEIQQLKNK